MSELVVVTVDKVVDVLLILQDLVVVAPAAIQVMEVMAGLPVVAVGPVVVEAVVAVLLLFIRAEHEAQEVAGVV
jgi:hypothetical protein